MRIPSSRLVPRSWVLIVPLFVVAVVCELSIPGLRRWLADRPLFTSLVSGALLLLFVTVLLETYLERRERVKWNLAISSVMDSLSNEANRAAGMFFDVATLALGNLQERQAGARRLRCEVAAARARVDKPADRLLRISPHRPDLVKILDRCYLLLDELSEAETKLAEAADGRRDLTSPDFGGLSPLFEGIQQQAVALQNASMSVAKDVATEAARQAERAASDSRS